MLDKTASAVHIKPAPSNSGTNRHRRVVATLELDAPVFLVGTKLFDRLPALHGVGLIGGLGQSHEIGPGGAAPPSAASLVALSTAWATGISTS